MDAYEATKVVFSRIQALDPDNAAKVMGLLLIQDHDEKEMIRLAFGPEAMLHSVIAQASKELALLTVPPTGAITGHTPFLFSRQNSDGGTAPTLLSVSSPSSWAQAPVFSRSNSISNGAAEEMVGSQEELVSPVNGGSGGAGAAPFFPQAADAFLDDFHLQEQLGFLNDGGLNPQHQLPQFDVGEFRSPGPGDGGVFPYGFDWANGFPAHRRSASVNELCLGGGDGFGWKPCLYYARGFCKNGSSCRFVHGDLAEDPAALAAAKMDCAAEQQQCHDFLLRSKSQRLGPASFPYSPTGSLPCSPSAATKCLSLLLQKQHNDNHRAAAAALMLAGGDEAHKFMGRPRLDRADFASMMNAGSRQIYLTFPADSTFREEDVSNYFSLYGPVHDVRIPYQQKRMFGFVTFVYPETVRLILAKGNPHFICDARVLVKPYKEKGKVPDKYRKQQQGDFCCLTPTGLDARETFDFHELDARKLQHSNSANELLLRRKLEEQQHAAELQQAIDLHSRRLIGLQLLDLKVSAAANAAETASATLPTPVVNVFTAGQHVATTILESPPSCNDQLKASNGSPPERNAVIGGDMSEPATEEAPKIDSDQSAEHNLPDSPFASPTMTTFSAAAVETELTAGPAAGNHLRPPTLDIPSPRTCFFPMPRLSSEHGAIGM
ncbi:hypothetical protein GUJ93_ZPchr0003g17553 [Zizania palustris]|uniref:Uncharacterized protein n=1 Tax=Zizania palustris TaxID=103762 RepID=A0A8J5V7L2_ZIZPA|nr:hypothetical protein GUJ93_ZPchr0003g17553 [Zizania palustris]